MPIFFGMSGSQATRAEQSLIEQNFSRDKRATKIDAAAAAIILQNVLDALLYERRD